ncbi:MAG: M1 family metallopeptidase [Pseudomonadota bacterium]
MSVQRCWPLLVVGLFIGISSASADVHSFANTDVYRQQHLHLDVNIDFDASILVGFVDIEFERQGRARPALILDTRDLVIRSVEVKSKQQWRRVPFVLGPDDANLGRALSIDLPSRTPRRFILRVGYETRPEASGLQWLTPPQTAGGEQPFLFSQSQAIHARSWVPLQDTPAVRFTFTAAVRTPPALRAVMGASTTAADPDAGRYEFDMPQPIPSYLMAIAAGELEFQAIGDRTGVYAEPSVLKAAAFEFADTERMLEISESLFGPYRWGRYDLLILPPSFPFGGMENPRLSFITPTVLAGDRSLVSLIAHELAHSWSGNLVTNSSWRDLWLNEGFTVFLEARIMEALYGADRRQMEERLGYEALLGDFATLTPPMQHLAVDLAGKDPDLVFSSVPYEKGRLMLVWLERAFGREKLNTFLQTYFDHFAFKSIATEDFLVYADTNLLADSSAGVSRSDLERWIFEPGLPDGAVLPSADIFEQVDAARRAFLEGSVAANAIDTAQWSTQDWLYFLNNLPDVLSSEQLSALDSAFGLTVAGNNEIAHSWLLIAIRNDYQLAWPRLEDYLLSIGRNKLVKPLYAALMQSERGSEFARDVFERARPGYHPLTVTVNERIVYPQGR